MKKYFDSLDSAQKKVVKFLAGFAVVIAAAGSGKTRVIERRTARLLENGAIPSSILLLTFTNKAAIEMLARARAFHENAKDVDGGTMHSFAHKLLRKHGHLIDLAPTFVIADTDKSIALITKIRARIIAKHDIKLPSPTKLFSFISYSKNNELSLKETIAYYNSETMISIKHLRRIAVQYRNMKQELGLVDFDDLLCFAVELLGQNYSVQEKLKKTFEHIMVDEFQDTNLVQMKFINLLYKFTGELGERSLMLVGDPGQSIYGFRGARFENWADILTSENATRFELETNYRSTPGIISLANAIDSDAQFIRKPAQPSRKAFDNGKPLLLSFKSASEEATAICERVTALHRNRVSYGQQAVLSRTVASLQRLEIELLARKIPYKLVGGLSLNKSAHIRDLMAIFEFILNSRDVIALERVLKLISGIGQKTAEKISETVTDQTRGLSWLALLRKEISNRNSDADTIIRAFKIATKLAVPVENRILRMAKLMKVVFDKMPQYSQNLEERMIDFDALAEIAQQFNSLQEFVSTMSLDPLSAGTGSGNGASKENPLTLSTIHSAKGLEWDVIFLPNLLEGKFPSVHAKSKVAQTEERRMFYVAVTRAKKCLILSRPVSFKKLGRKEIFKDSPFLEIRGVKNVVKHLNHVSSATHPERSAS